MDKEFVYGDTSYLNFKERVPDDVYLRLMSKEHPGAANRNRVQEHRAIAEHKVIKRQLRPEEVVHHLDMNPRNNAPSNLLVLENTQHSKLHSWLDKYTITTNRHKYKIKSGRVCKRCIVCECPIEDRETVCSDVCREEMEKNKDHYEQLIKESKNIEGSLYANKNIEVDKEWLEKQLLTRSMIDVSEELGMSDNGLKKMCIRLGIDLTKRKHSHKNYTGSKEGADYVAYRDYMSSNITKEQLMGLLTDHPFKDVCKYLGYNETSTEHICKKYDIDRDKINQDRRIRVKKILEETYKKDNGILTEESLMTLLFNNVSNEAIQARYKIHYRKFYKLRDELLVNVGINFRISYVINLIRKGLTPKEIADDLGISVESVLICLFRHNQYYTDNQVLPNVNWLLDKLKINNNVKLLADKLGVSKEYLLSWLE